MIKIIKHNQIVTLICSSVCFSVSTFAQTTEAVPQQIEKIEISGLRSPDMMPYKDAYEYLQKLNQKPHDKIAVRMRIVPQNKNLSLHDIKITLRGDKTNRAIPIADDGLIEVPLEKALVDDNAEFVTNQKKNSLQVHVNIDVSLPTNSPLRYRYLSEALVQARDSVKQIVPWYVRWLVPNNWNAVEIEFAEGSAATATVMAVNGKQVFRSGKENKIKMLLEDYLISENPEVVFSTPPKSIGAGSISDMLSYAAQKPE
jgi:Protein of unknown function (DUF2987)